MVALSLVHLRQRRGQATVVEICVVRRDRDTLWPFNHVVVHRLSMSIRRRWSCHDSIHELLAPVTSSLSGRHRAIANSQATALESYKLSVPSAPLCSQAPNTPTRASDYPPESPNLRLPPNRSRAPYWVSSSWPMLYRSVPALYFLVSVPLCALDASRPGWLTRTHKITGNASSYPLIALSPWAERLGPRTLKLVEGKWLLGVKLDVNLFWAPVIAYLGRYRLAGGTAPTFSIVDLVLWRNRSARVLVQLLVTQEIVLQTLFKLFKTPGAFAQSQ
jgi:hypothetical protein